MLMLALMLRSSSLAHKLLMPMLMLMLVSLAIVRAGLSRIICGAAQIPYECLSSKG